MDKNKILIFIGCVLFSTATVFAQSSSGNIKGMVCDSENDAELIGASIHINSVNRSGVSDENGEFSFNNIPEGKYLLQISFMGYKSQSKQVELKTGETKEIKIRLIPDENSLSEVTVTAKTEARKLKEEGMPVTVINMSSLQGTVTSISDILSKTVGMTIRTSGGVGSASRISVRGLEGKRIGFFIDEIPLNDQSDFIDLNDIPVDMIERIEIYKGVVPARFGGSSMGGAVNIKIKEYPDKYMDVSYMRESFNSNKLQVVSKRNLKDKGLIFGVGGGYTYADNDYTMTSPYQEGLKIKRNHDRFQKILIGGSFKATKWWFDEVEFELVFIDTKKEIQGIETDIRKAETNSRAFLFANTLKKEDFLLPGLDLDFSTAVAFTKINLIDTAKVRYDWDGNPYTTTKYGGELGNQYAANSNDKKFTLINKINLEYMINESHSVNFNSVFNLANGYPEDSLRNLSLGRQSVFDSKMRSWVGGINYDFRTKDDKFLNSVTARYYIYSMNTKKSQIYGGDNVKDIDLSKNDFGISNAMRYKFKPDLMAKFSVGYDVRIPSETELLGDGYSISPSEGLVPERNTSVNLGLLYDRVGISSNDLQIELSLFYMHLENMIRFTKGFIDAQYQNFGEMRTLGVEFDVKMDLFPWLYGYFNTTFQDLRDVRKYEEESELPNPTKGKRMPNIPYLMGNAGLEFHKENLFGGRGQNTRIFSDASYIEEYFYDFEMTTNSQRRIPQSLTFDIGFEHSLMNNRLFLSGKIKNLTDKNLLSEFNRPLPGRSLGFKIRYIFK
ncbi:TonB-dependent receptor [Dysgonomonas sp. GY75]|uniref:TonB-dependent receptor n=1 Tax=Dysgonomonas sp. GY75 TaxID=2780419 RepID=UPI001883B45A|nr:TonB-dependent receptor [Dysgonomonas sp. GY75]MBF0650896.1 TonB-dependent receptor [Dysgonomonas sp. GY75]